MLAGIAWLGTAGAQAAGLLTPADGSSAGITRKAVTAAVVIATHMIIDTWGWIASGDSQRAVRATAIPRAFATMGGPARSIARRT